MENAHKRTYIISLIATLAIFAAAFIVSSYFNNKKTDSLKASEDKVAIDITSLETQYDILRSSSCSGFNQAALREELDSLSSKLSFMEGQVGANDPEVFRLKRYFSLLEIKDYLLNKQMSAQCKLDNIFVLYFYSEKNCDKCQTQGYLLKAIEAEYPQIEFYSFDFDLFTCEMCMYSDCHLNC